LVNGVEVKIVKRIPPGTGLAGGSGNAAGALLAFRKLFNIPLKGEDMVKLSSQVGSDVPFMLTGGCAIVSGRGEVVEKLPAVAGDFFVVVTPPVKVDTAKAYQLLDEHRAGWAHKLGSPEGIYFEARSAWLAALASGVFDFLMHNDFEEAIYDSHPKIADVKANIGNLGIPVYLTGSGSAVFTHLTDYAHTLEVMEQLRSTYDDAVHLCQPTNEGVVIID
jgi:4-diphosphocytidyl-2-C-methyl-D-erythritol kinase